MNTQELNIHVFQGVSNREQDYISYVVQIGDTLSSIAHRYDTDYQILADLNNLSDPDLIFPGQTIKLPESSTSTAKFYTVQEGDTLSQIAVNTGTTVYALEDLNGLNHTDNIYIGSILRIC